MFLLSGRGALPGLPGRVQFRSRWLSTRPGQQHSLARRHRHSWHLRRPARLVSVACAPITPAATGAVHVVEAGETLYDIASQYGITTRQLKEANIQDLDAAGKSDIRTVHRVIYKSDIIYPGQELKLPSNAAIMQAVPAAPIPAAAVPPRMLAGEGWLTAAATFGAMALVLLGWRFLQSKRLGRLAGTEEALLGPAAFHSDNAAAIQAAIAKSDAILADVSLQLPAGGRTSAAHWAQRAGFTQAPAAASLASHSTDEDAEDTTPAAAPSAAPVAQAPMPVSDAAGAADAPASTPQAAEGADARQGAIATKTVETPDLLKVAITAAASTAAALSSDSELSLAPWEGETMMSMDSEPASAALTGLLQEATAVLTAHEPHNPHQTAALAASTAGAGVGESGAAAPQAPPMAALAAPAVTDTVELPQTLRPQAPVAEVTDTVEIPEALLPQAPAVVVTRTVEIPEALQPQPVVVRTVELPDALLPQPPVAVVTRTVEIPEALLPQPAVMDTVEIPEAMLPQPLVAPITDTIEIPEALQVSAPAVQAPAAVDLTQTIEIPQAFQVGGSAVQGSAQPAAADVTQTVDIPQAFQVGGDPAPQEAQSPPAATHTIEIPKTFHMKAAAIPQTAAASALPDMAARTVSEGASAVESTAVAAEEALAEAGQAVQSEAVADHSAGLVSEAQQQAPQLETPVVQAVETAEVAATQAIGGAEATAEAAIDSGAALVSQAQQAAAVLGSAGSEVVTEAQQAQLETPVVQAVETAEVAATQAIGGAEATAEAAIDSGAALVSQAQQAGAVLGSAGSEAATEAQQAQLETPVVQAVETAEVAATQAIGVADATVEAAIDSGAAVVSQAQQAGAVLGTAGSEVVTEAQQSRLETPVVQAVETSEVAATQAIGGAEATAEAAIDSGAALLSQAQQAAAVLGSAGSEVVTEAQQAQLETPVVQAVETSEVAATQAIGGAEATAEAAIDSGAALVSQAQEAGAVLGSAGSDAITEAQKAVAALSHHTAVAASQAGQAAQSITADASRTVSAASGELQPAAEAVTGTIAAAGIEAAARATTVAIDVASAGVQAAEQAAAAITVGDLKTKPAAQQSFISSLVNTVTEQQQVHQKIERLIKALEGDAPAQEAMNTGGEAGAVWNNIQPLPSSRPGAYPFSTNTQPELVSGGGFGSSSLPQGGGGTAVLSAPAATAVAVELPRSFVAAPPAPARSGESVAASPVAEVVLEVKAGAEPATSSDLVAKPSEPVMEVLAPEQAAPTQPAPAHVFSPELLLEPVAALPAAASAPGAAEVGESTASAGSTTTYDAAPAAADPMAIAVSKAQLLDSVYGTGRGLDAPVDVRAKVEKLLHELEGLKPRLRPAKALELLAGRWKMVYTSSAQVLMLMNAIRQIPLIAIGDISQAIDSETAMVHNKVDIAVPFMMSLSTQAGLEVRTTRQFKVKFQLAGVNTQILTPKLLDNLEVPDSLSLLGQKIDLSPLRDALSPMNVALQRMRSVTTSALAPDLPAVEGSTPPDVHAWLETTYLDDNLRVCRDEAGGVFVLVKDVSLH